MPPRWKAISRRTWLRVGYGAVALVASVLLVLGGTALFRWAWPAAGARAENRSNARIPEEELVKRYILNNAEDPKAVEFVRWGPHMTRQEWQELWKEAGLALDDPRWREGDRKELAAVDMIVRVVYRSPDALLLAQEGKKGIKTNDELFIVSGKMVVPPMSLFSPKAAGDDWKKTLRKNLAKLFPAINTE